MWPLKINYIHMKRILMTALVLTGLSHIAPGQPMDFSPLRIQYMRPGDSNLNASLERYDTVSQQARYWNVQAVLPVYRNKEKNFVMAARLNYEQIDLDWTGWADSTYSPRRFHAFTPFIIGRTRLSENYQLIAGVSLGFGKERDKQLSGDDLLLRHIFVVSRGFGADKRLRLGIGVFVNSAFGNFLILPLPRASYAFSAKTQLSLNMVRLRLDHALTANTSVFFSINPQGNQLRVNDPADNELGYDKIRERMAVAGLGIRQNLGRWFRLELIAGAAALRRWRFFNAENDEVLDMRLDRVMNVQAGLMLRIPESARDED